MNKNIDTIIFDLGNVVINISPEIYISEFQRLGVDVHHPDLQFLSDRIECGLNEFSEFVVLANDIFNVKHSAETYRIAWNSILLDFPNERIAVIERLRLKYKVFLLSNTNAIHQEAFCASFRGKFGFAFENLFDKAYYSHQMGCRKPDLEIYEKMIADSGVFPVNALFIDDIEANVNAAQACGLNVKHASEGFNIANFFDKW